MWPCASSPQPLSRRGFTLAEVLAALAFMAIVIPVAVEGVRIASRAGQVGERKAVAARIADRVLSEAVLLSQRQQASQNGTVMDGPHQYRWTIRNDPWTQGTLRVMTVQVVYLVQGSEFDVRLSTLIDAAAQ